MGVLKSRSLLAAAIGSLVILPAVPALAANVATWNVDGSTNPANVVPLVANSGADAGAANGIPLGMSGYTNANGANNPADVICDILSTPGASTGATSNAWRVRSEPNNGWAQSPAVQPGGAPQYTQGAEFDASTVGFSAIKVSFDWFSTNQGVKDMQEQYTTDGTNWININPLLIATPNGWNNGQLIDLTAIPTAENDAGFGIRLVSAYDPTITSVAEYGGASGGAYNNNSGNWRFDNIAVTGTPITTPEPASLALLTVAVLGLAGRRSLRN